MNISLWNFCFAPLRLAWNCVKASILANDTDFNMELYKDLTENEKWGILQQKLSSEVFAISLCLDLKQTFYRNHIQWNNLINIIKKHEKKIANRKKDRTKTPQNNPPAGKDIIDVDKTEREEPIETPQISKDTNNSGEKTHTNRYKQTK